MRRNRGGVNANGRGTNALSCVSKFVRARNRRKRRGVKNAASLQGWRFHFPIPKRDIFLSVQLGNDIEHYAEAQFYEEQSQQMRQA